MCPPPASGGAFSSHNSTKSIEFFLSPVLVTVQVARTGPAGRRVFARPCWTHGKAGSRRPTRSRYQIGSRQHTNGKVRVAMILAPAARGSGLVVRDVEQQPARSCSAPRRRRAAAGRRPGTGGAPCPPGRNTACASRRNSEIPTIISTTESSSPPVLRRSVTSPKPVVERRHGEVERVDEVLDLRVDPALGDVDQRRRHQDEHGEVERGGEQLLVAAHRREELLELAEHVVGPEQPDGAQHPQEGEVADQRREEQRESTTRSTTAAALSR